MDTDPAINGNADPGFSSKKKLISTDNFSNKGLIYWFRFCISDADPVGKMNADPDPIHLF